METYKSEDEFQQLGMVEKITYLSKRAFDILKMNPGRLYSKNPKRIRIDSMKFWISTLNREFPVPVWVKSFSELTQNNVNDLSTEDIESYEDILMSYYMRIERTVQRDAA